MTGDVQTRGRRNLRLIDLYFLSALVPRGVRDRPGHSDPISLVVLVTNPHFHVEDPGEQADHE